jgi:hypothetical protein
LRFDASNLIIGRCASISLDIVEFGGKTFVENSYYQQCGDEFEKWIRSITVERKV